MFFSVRFTDSYRLKISVSDIVSWYLAQPQPFLSASLMHWGRKHENYNLHISLLSEFWFWFLQREALTEDHKVSREGTHHTPDAVE